MNYISLQKWIELFAWEWQISKIARENWIEMVSVDWTAYEWINMVADILTLTIKDFPYVPDFFWASPDCTTYSIAACSTHRNPDRSAKSEYAKKCDTTNKHWISLMKEFLEINPNMICWIENPRGILRKMDFMKELEQLWFKRHTVWYCQYWDERPKPTDIWTNSKTWIPRPECHNYKYDEEGNIIDKHCHHDSARRWSPTGTQWRKNAHERSKIPTELCEEIILSMK